MDDLQQCHSRIKRARYLALHDDLTALPNRQYFLRRLRIALRHGASSPTKVAIIYLHIDGFKAVNETHGLAAGNTLLRLAASRLVQSARAEDFVSRIIANEFACLVTESPSRHQLQLLACSIYDRMCTPFQLRPTAVQVHASIGVSSYPEDGIAPESLMDAAVSELARARGRDSNFHSAGTSLAPPSAEYYAPDLVAD